MKEDHLFKKPFETIDHQKLQEEEHQMNHDLKHCVVLFEACFDSSVTRAKDIARYIASGGKKMRAMLVLSVGNLCNIKKEKAIILATAVESMHMATLLHDDVLDGSIRRRHRQTAHHVWDTQSSILGGDFLLAGVFQLLLKVENFSILESFASTAMVMAEAELLQMENRSQHHMDQDLCLKVIEGKTASLFSFATQCCTMLSSSQNDRKALATYGHHLGMAFQIIDDVIDYQSSAQDMGKEAFDDWVAGHITLPIVVAYQQGTEKHRRTLRDLLLSLSTSNDKQHIHQQVTKILQETGAIDQVLQQAYYHGQCAQEQLATVKNAPHFLHACIQKALKRKA